MAGQKFYVVFVGRVPGVYCSWEECHQQVTYYRGANYISVTTLEEAERRFSTFQRFKNREPATEPEGSDRDARRFSTSQRFKNREPATEPEGTDRDANNPASSYRITRTGCGIYLFGILTGVVLMFFWNLLM